MEMTAHVTKEGSIPQKITTLYPYSVKVTFPPQSEFEIIIIAQSGFILNTSTVTKFMHLQPELIKQETRVFEKPNIQFTISETFIFFKLLSGNDFVIDFSISL